MEHRPVMKEFVTVTRFAGEHELQEGRNTEHMGTQKRIMNEDETRGRYQWRK